MELIPVVELGVSEAYALLTEHFGMTDLPPLDAIEYEDWGRDLLLGRFTQIPAEALAEAGVTLSDEGEFRRMTDERGDGIDPFPRSVLGHQPFPLVP